MASSLSILFPAVPVMVGGERLQLRPVVLAELPTVDRVMEAWRMLVATDGQALDADAWEDVLSLMSSAVDRPRAWVDGLLEPEFERLFSLVLAANEDIWKAEPAGTGEASLDWAAIFQHLVSHGHSLQSIHGYTLAQAHAFLTECLKEEREALARDIQSAAFSMADGKTVTKVVKEIRRG